MVDKNVVISDGTLDAWYSVISGEKEWSDTHLFHIPDIRKSLLMAIDYIRELRKELDKYETLGKQEHDVEEFYAEDCRYYISKEAPFLNQILRDCIGDGSYLCDSCYRLEIEE